MKKLSAIIEANLKRFLRDKKSVFLLIVLPLILISSIFLSFNTQGLSKIPVGIITNLDYETILDYENEYFSYLKFTPYANTDVCLSQLRSYQEYVCLVIPDFESTEFHIFYDNTREPVIWEVLERIKTTFQILQQMQTIQITDSMLNELKGILDQTTLYSRALEQSKNKIRNYQQEVTSTQKELRSAETDLTTTLNQMDDDIRDARLKQSEIDRDRRAYYSMIKSYIYQLRVHLNNPLLQQTNQTKELEEQLDDLEEQVDSENEKFKEELDEIDKKIDSYERQSQKGRQYVYKLSLSANKLSSIHDDLKNYEISLSEKQKELVDLEHKLTQIISVDPEKIVTPFTLITERVYIPEGNINSEELEVKEINEGLNLLGLQTLFPTVLLLLSTFLSLLVSSFITIKYVNADVNQRIMLIDKMLLPEIFGVYISCLMILSAPIFVLLMVGELLFKIPVGQHMGSVLLNLFLLVSIFVFLGMLLAYIIRKESITLVVASFILVFFVFMSGFILSVERMSDFVMKLANLSPGRLSHIIFNQAVFYGNDFTAYFVVLGFWLFVVLSATIIFRAQKYHNIN